MLQSIRISRIFFGENLFENDVLYTNKTENETDPEIYQVMMILQHFITNLNWNIFNFLSCQ